MNLGLLKKLNRDTKRDCAMTEVTVEKLAAIVGTPVSKLIEQMQGAGLDLKKPSDFVSDEQKQTLLTFLKESHGESVKEAPKKITLQRKTKSSLKITGATGKAKTVTVEVRKKRTYVKKSVLDEARKAEEDARRVEEEAEQQKIAAEKAALELKEKQKEEEAALLNSDADKSEAGKKESQDTASESASGKQQASTTQSKAVGGEKKDSVSTSATDKKESSEKTEGSSEKQTDSASDKKFRANTETQEKEEQKTKSKRRRRSSRANSENDINEVIDKYSAPTRRPGRQENNTIASTKPIRAPKALQHGFSKPTTPVSKVIDIPELITVSELAQKMSIKAPVLMKSLMKMGVMATINQSLDQETAVLVAEDLGYETELTKTISAEDNVISKEELQSSGEKNTRAPVVTIMGHVDHGKTSLLDYIRTTKVADGEAGGITQHIGAYHVTTDKGGITFLDTPGHAAFTAMRARGANATDIVILVVAADDGVMPQTIEAVQHARAAEVPLIVAVNKIDKPESDPDRIKNELSQHDVLPEDWGGDTQFIHVSAKTGEGVNELLEAISLQAEILELQAVQTGYASGVVIEGRLDKGRGTIASVLVQSGQLNKGDILLAGFYYGRVRALINDDGVSIDSAGPSMPVEVLGLSGVPSAGDDVIVVENERKAREVAEYRQEKIREEKLAKQQASKLENLFANIGDDEKKHLNILVKADVQGSVEALSQALQELSVDEVDVSVIATGVGGITETDVSLAAASNAIMIGFNVRADAAARKVIDSEGTDLRYYSVIYDVINDVKSAMSGLLSPVQSQNIVGLAEVRDVFRSPKLGAIAGCMVIEGYVKRNNPIRVLRDNVVIFEGELESLRRFKDDVNEVRNGMECGIGVKNYNDVKVGDQIECFEIVEEIREL